MKRKGGLGYKAYWRNTIRETGEVRKNPKINGSMNHRYQSANFEIRTWNCSDQLS
jgi:hypothetical protein